MRSLVATTVRVGLVLASVAAPLAAQDAPVTRDSITLVPGPQFSTTSWIRWLGTALFGARYRVVWNTPITLPVLDLAATAGGLRTAGAGTSHAAGLLHLDGVDGSHWTFLPLDRTDPRSFPSGIVPASVSAGIIADLTSGRNPAGPLVAAALAEAAGVPNQPAWLVALPPRTSLGPLQAGDSGLAGYLLRRDPVPTSDSTGPVAPGSVITSLALLHRTRQDPAERVDARAALQASLFNVYVGGLDPLFLDWRWEAIPSPEGGLSWRPLRHVSGRGPREVRRHRGVSQPAAPARPHHLRPRLSPYTDRDPGPGERVPIPHRIARTAGLGFGGGRVAGEPHRFRHRGGGGHDARRLPGPGRGPAHRDPARTPRQPPACGGPDVQAGARAGGGVRERRGGGSDGGVAGARLAGTAAWEPELQRFAASETERVTLFLGGGRDTVRIAGERGRAPSLRVVPMPVSPLVVEGEVGKSPAAVYGKGIEVAAEPGAIPLRPTEVGDPLAHLDSTGAVRTEGRRNFHPTGWLELTSGVGLPHRRRRRPDRLVGRGAAVREAGDPPARGTAPIRTGASCAAGQDFPVGAVSAELHVDAVASAVGAIYFYGFGNDTPGDSASSYYRAGRELYGFAALARPAALEAGQGGRRHRAEVRHDTGSRYPLHRRRRAVRQPRVRRGRLHGAVRPRHAGRPRGARRGSWPRWTAPGIRGCATAAARSAR